MRTLSRISRFLRSRAGNVAIISALMLPVLVGFAGLGTETAWWYSRQREIQAAADIAAYDAALKRRDGGTANDAKTVGTATAITNGWNQPIGTIAVNSPPTSGGYQNVQAVEVTLTENLPPFVSAIVLGNTTIPVSARSTATMRTGDPACILGLNPAASATVEFWGNSTASLFNCVVASNSTSATGFKLGGSADLTTPCVYSSGGASYDAGLVLTDTADCPAPVTNHPATLDPYADVPPPSPIPSCGNMPSGNSINPPGDIVCYNGMSFPSNQTTTLKSNTTYVVNGGEFDVGANSVVNATNVTIYLTNGAVLDIRGGSTLNMSAKTTGDQAGLLFFGDRTQANATNQVNGNAVTNLTGAFYFPTQRLEFLGNFGGTHGCVQVIGDTVNYTGSANFQNNCAGTGVKDLITVGNIKLVE